MKNPVALGILLSLVAIASASAHDDMYDLSYKPKEGDAASYKTAMALSVMSMDVSFSAVLKRKVTKVEADGGYTVEGVQYDVKLKMGEQEEQTMPDSPGTTSKFGPKGELLNSTVPASSAMSEMLSAVTHIVTPVKPVAKGDKWTTDLKLVESARTVAATMNYELVGVEKYADQDCIKLKYTYKEVGTEGTGDGLIYLDAVDHKLVGVDGSFKAMIPQPGAPVADGTFKVTLVKA